MLGMVVDEDITEDVSGDSTFPDYFEYGFELEKKDQDSGEIFTGELKDEKLLCIICGNHNSLKQHSLYCRVCGDIYHCECLASKGHCVDNFFEAAFSEVTENIGWSCPECENLTKLLTDEENYEIIEMFDDMAGNGTSISREGFLQARRDVYKNVIGLPMPRYREKQENELFDLMDLDKSGTVEWWEYNCPMCIRILSRKPACEHLRLLTPLEIDKVRKIFKSYDKGNTGKVSLKEAKKIFFAWRLSLSKLSKEDKECEEWKLDHEDFIDSAIPIKAREPDVTWLKYLRETALAILSARPNRLSQTFLFPTVTPSFTTQAWDLN